MTTFTCSQYPGYGRVKVTIWVSETFGITRLHAWAERVTPVYMEFVISWEYPDVNGDARLASGRTDNLKTQYASFPILLPVSKDNNNSSSTRIMNSSGQIAIAFVCAFLLAPKVWCCAASRHVYLYFLFTSGILHAGFCMRRLYSKDQDSLRIEHAQNTNQCSFWWGYADTRLHDQIFGLEKGYPRGNIRVFKNRDMSISGFLPVFTWPCATGLLLISRFWTGYWLHVNVVYHIMWS